MSVKLSNDQLKLCPFGDHKCKICRLPPEDIESVHKLYLEKRWSTTKISKHLKDCYAVELDRHRVSKHFKQHIRSVFEETIAKQSKHPEIIKALAVVDDAIKVKTDKDIEKAYQSLVKMSISYTSKVRELQKVISTVIEGKVANGALDNEINGLSALELLERLAKINREAREQVKDISALRAPKVMVAQLLENFFIAVIKEMGRLLSDMCGQVKYDITEDLKSSGQLRLIDPAMFDTTFRRVGIDFRDAMLSIKREQMGKAMSSLADLEKII